MQYVLASWDVVQLTSARKGPFQASSGWAIGVLSRVDSAVIGQIGERRASFSLQCSRRTLTAFHVCPLGILSPLKSGHKGCNTSSFAASYMVNFPGCMNKKLCQNLGAAGHDGADSFDMMDNCEGGWEFGNLPSTASFGHGSEGAVSCRECFVSGHIFFRIEDRNVQASGLTSTPGQRAVELLKSSSPQIERTGQFVVSRCGQQAAV